MELLYLLKSINGLLALPATIIFFGAAVLLTFKTRFIQIRAFPRFIRLIIHGVKRRHEHGTKTIDSFHALFTAMGTTIGMGNVVGPSVAIMAGGPGALFWLLVYIFFGSVTKFTEVVFALHTRIRMADGSIIGGPMEYLKLIGNWLARWYVLTMIIMVVSWSSAQSNTLAQIFASEGVQPWIIGASLAILVLLVLQGGAQRVGNVASKLVPLMFILYVTFAIIILCKDFVALKQAIRLVFASIVSPEAAFGGFAGSTMMAAMRAGIFKAIFITEAGVGTSSIPHAVADTQRPTDQGILALFSMLSDALLCSISGLLVLVTGVWMSGTFKSTLVYDVFRMNAPEFGKIVLLISITLFIVTTVIGNTFNGVQNFASLTNNRGLIVYIFFTMIMVFAGSIMRAELVWEAMETVLALVAVPNVIGLIIIAYKKPEWLKG